MVGIPPALDNDDEDVVWALQTAEALWKRNERIDAIVWLRRAAQSAGEAENDDRALTLARDAAELAEWVAANPQSAPVSSSPAAPSDHPASAAVEDLLRASQADIDVAAFVEPLPTQSAVVVGDEIDAVTTPIALAHRVPPAYDDTLAVTDSPPIPRRADDAPVDAPPDLSAEDAPTDATYDSLPPVAPSAAEKHAGMLDPWSDGDAGLRKERIVARSAPADSFDEDEVITSAPSPAVSSVPPRTPSPVPPAPPPLPPRPAAPKKPAQPPPRPPAAPKLSKPPAPPPPPPPPDAVVEPPPPPAAPSPPPAPPEPGAEPAPASEPPAAAATSPSLPPVPPDAAPSGFDLGNVDAFSDLPDDARAAFAAAATIHELAMDEEVSQIALALVLEGEVDVSATIVDAAAERLVAGAVLRTRGTLEHVTALRLRAASEHVRVATWDDAAVEAAFGTCPWVEDELRSAGDRVQALVGATMGLLGERLDAALLGQVTSRLTVRALAEGEAFVEKGTAVPGLLVVGIGELEIVNDDVVESALAPGDFLFATEVLSAGPAPATARAGKGGALVLVADRHAAQELLVTCPPLLEIFAGM